MQLYTNFKVKDRGSAALWRGLETYQLNAMWDSGTDSEAEKRLLSKTPRKVLVFLTVLRQC